MCLLLSSAIYLDAWSVDSMPVRAGALLQGVKDPEAKRKAIGAEFIRVFQEFADIFKKEHGVSPKCAPCMPPSMPQPLPEWRQKCCCIPSTACLS